MSTVSTPRRLTLQNLPTMQKGGLPQIVITSARPDRMRDVIVPEGVLVPDRVPVLFGHKTDDLPVGKMVSHRVVPGRDIIATFQWVEHDPRAAAVKNVYDQDMLSASVGLTVYEHEPNHHGGVTITKSELIEFSLTSTPANPDCRPVVVKWVWGEEYEPVYRFPTEDEPIIRLIDDDDAPRHERRVRTQLEQPRDPVYRIDAQEYREAHAAMAEMIVGTVRDYVADRVQEIGELVTRAVRSEVNYLRGRVE